MPLVRIDVRKGKDVAYRQEIGRVVYEALVGVGAPKDDRFQVISEYDSDSFLFDPDYLGIHRTNDLVIIQITWNEGRNPEQKKALYKAIADGLHSAVGLRREDLLITGRGQKRRTGLMVMVLPSMQCEQRMKLTAVILRENSKND